MINWDEFEHIHVIKKLKQILSTWWCIDVIFTDDRGQIRGFQNTSQTIVNPAVMHFLSNDTAKQNLADSVAQTIEEMRSSDTRFDLKKWAATGFDMVIFPIILQGEFMGTVIGTGFIKDTTEANRMEEVREKITALGLAPDAIGFSLSKIRLLDDSNRAHFIDLVDLVSKEIITLHLEITGREERIRELNKELGSRYKYDNMIGKSKAMQGLYSLLDKIKAADSTVLIQGENGTGKELIAKSIHYNSARSNKQFVIQNCSAFNDNLLESELFGHVKGSFTGAHKDKKGLFEIADQGTFFLDEIGDTSPQMQVKLLRVLQEGTFTPVGALEGRKVDVRVVAATNRNLREMVEKGTFREDLFYRLNVINLSLIHI